MDVSIRFVVWCAALDLLDNSIHVIHSYLEEKQYYHQELHPPFDRESYWLGYHTEHRWRHVLRIWQTPKLEFQSL